MVNFDPKGMLFIKNVCGSLVILQFVWFCLGWLSKMPRALGGYPAIKIGSVSLSNIKRLLTDCLHSFMQRVGFTNVFIFYVFFCLFRIQSYLPTHTRWIWTLSWLQTQQHRCAVCCKTISNQSTCVCGGKEQGLFLLVISICCKTVMITEMFESM